MSVPDPAVTKWIPLAGMDMVYNGQYPAGTPYTDGDVVIHNGVAYLCVRPTSAAPTPWTGTRGARSFYGSTPPSPAADGDEWTLPADATNGVNWTFRYNAASASAYKWEFIGGAPLLARVETNENTGSTTYVALATAGPSVALPRAGDYDITIGFFFNAVGTGTTLAMSFDVGATPAVDADGVVGYNAVAADLATSNQDTRRKTGLAAVTLTAKYKIAGANGWFGNRRMIVLPVRVA